MMNDVLYEGQRLSGRTLVWIVDDLGEKRPLPHAIVRHSPDGYEWGYGGSGPADLALNLLVAALGAAGECWSCGGWGEGHCAHCHGTGLAPVVQQGYQTFKWDFIALIADDGWTVTRTEIIEWAAAFESQRAALELLRLADAAGGSAVPLPGATGDPARPAPRGVPS